MDSMGSCGWDIGFPTGLALITLLSAFRPIENYVMGSTVRTRNAFRCSLRRAVAMRNHIGSKEQSGYFVLWQRSQIFNNGLTVQHINHHNPDSAGCLSFMLRPLYRFKCPDKRTYKGDQPIFWLTPCDFIRRKFLCHPNVCQGKQVLLPMFSFFAS